MGLLLVSSSLWSYSIYTQELHKWGNPTFGTGAAISYSFMPAGVNCAVNTGRVPPPCSTVSLNSSMPVGYQGEIRRAFDAWSTVANLTFNEVPDLGENMEAGSQLSGDIRIGTNNIDGAYGTLAYAYYPFNNTGLYAGGDIQFDSGESWKVGARTGGFDVFLVALHEIGHSLGLAHEGSTLAIMNPYYNSSLVGLQSDDISGIQAIYGAAIPQAVPAPGAFWLMLLGSLLLYVIQIRRRKIVRS